MRDALERIAYLGSDCPPAMSGESFYRTQLQEAIRTAAMVLFGEGRAIVPRPIMEFLREDRAAIRAAFIQIAEGEGGPYDGVAVIGGRRGLADLAIGWLDAAMGATPV